MAHKDSYFVRKVSTFAQKLGSGQLYLYILYIRAPGLAGVEGAVEKSENVKWSKSVPKEKSAKKCAKFFKKVATFASANETKRGRKVEWRIKSKKKF